MLDGIRLKDEASLLALYDRYSGVSYGVIFHIVRDEGIAEELMQDIFFMLWRRPEVYDPVRGAFAAWITVVSRHRAVDALRRRRPEVQIEDMDFCRECKQFAEASFAETMTQVRDILGSLPSEQRSVFELAYFEGLSHSEICKKTGQPLGTIKSRLRAALNAVRTTFGADAA